MMKTIISAITLLLLFFSTAKAQDCDAFFPVKSGVSLTMESYDAKGKVESKTVQTIKNITNLPGGFEMNVHSQNFDPKGAPVFEGEYTVKCDNGVTSIDMKRFMGQLDLTKYEGMEMKIQSQNIEIPSSLNVGQMLNEGNITISFSSNGMTVFNMTTRIFNRKVEAQESITTPAGTFQCYKISYDIEVKSMIKVTTKATEWYAKKVGIVKSESYDKNGKLTGYSLLTDIKQ